MPTIEPRTSDLDAEWCSGYRLGRKLAPFGGLNAVEHQERTFTGIVNSGVSLGDIAWAAGMLAGVRHAILGPDQGERMPVLAPRSPRKRLEPQESVAGLAERYRARVGLPGEPGMTRATETEEAPM